MVLIVEDSPLNARLAQELLSRAGLQVTLAMDAVATLETLDRLTPDLILMDMALPGMSGGELTRLLKADPSRCGIPIIAFSANDSSAELHGIADAGCNGFISKPIAPLSFVSQVKSYIPLAEPLPSVGNGDPGHQCSRNVVEEEQQLLLKQKFLSEGVEESRDLLACDEQVIDRILQRWIGCGGPAGLPEISLRAVTIRNLISRRVADLAALTIEANAIKILFDDALVTCHS